MKKSNACCKECKHCNKEEMVCRPNSKDCRSEYKLTKEDLETPARCDFFEKLKENNH